MTQPPARGSSLWWWIIALVVVVLVLWLFWAWGWGGAAVTPEEPPEVETEGLDRDDEVRAEPPVAPRPAARGSAAA